MKRFSMLLIAALVLGSSPAWSQGDEGTPGTQDQTRQRVMERIENDPTLDAGQRERMRENLRQCEQLGLAPEELNALFPDGSSGYSAQARLRIQEQVMTLAQEGRPVDLICDKMNEGRLKGAPEPTMTRVTEQVGENLRFAHQYLEQAQNDGIKGPSDPAQERHLERGVALNRWRGLEDGEFDQLRDRARDRARIGDCDLTDLCAATETATELREMGIDSPRVMQLCGDALQEGYRAREIRQLGWMVGEANHYGANGAEVCDQLQQRVRHQEQMGEMVQQMQRQGWMGPESMGSGHGGHSPVDDVMGGGHHGDGDGGMGGNGGGGHGGGGHDGMGGNGGSGGN